MLRLLHVDDDQDILEVARMSLELNGDFEICQCTSGLEALQIAPTFKPQILLLDIMMPKMSGDTTLVKLREIEDLKKVPAIFMTARVQPHEIEKYKSLGVLDVIIKPFDPLELSDIVTAILVDHRYKV